MGFFQDLSNEVMKFKLLKEAEIAQDNGDTMKAINTYSKLIDRNCYSDEEDSNFYEFRADLYFKQYDDREKAFTDLCLSLVMNPLNDRSLAKRGVLYFLNDEFEEAAIDIQKALEINPSNETALMIRNNLNENKEMQQ